MEYLIATVEQDQDISFLHGYLTWALLRIVIESNHTFLARLITDGNLLLLSNKLKSQIITPSEQRMVVNDHFIEDVWKIQIKAIWHA